MYQTKISDIRWIVYDIPGNIGWITYITSLILLLANQITIISLISVFPAFIMVVGIIELISERIAKLDRVLPKIRLYRGFGMLTLGGSLGVIISVIAVIDSLFKNGRCLYQIIMFLGAMLCFIFGGLLFKGYKKIK
ncbi:MAG: hypothetical protein IJV39_01125 [Ruminococcus sp.]|nr:hypothetical protein [Ruminococcus sp.]